MSSGVQKSEVGNNFQNDRELPQNIEAEQNVLGSIFMIMNHLIKFQKVLKKITFMTLCIKRYLVLAVNL